MLTVIVDHKSTVKVSVSYGAANTLERFDHTVRVYAIEPGLASRSHLTGYCEDGFVHCTRKSKEKFTLE